MPLRNDRNFGWFFRNTDPRHSPRQRVDNAIWHDGPDDAREGLRPPPLARDVLRRAGTRPPSRALLLRAAAAERAVLRRRRARRQPRACLAAPRRARRR